MHSPFKKKILITGATGYLALRIAETLEKYHNYIFIFGCRDLKKTKQLPLFEDKILVKFDIAQPETFNTSLKDIDYILHLASMNAQDSAKNPELAQKLNGEAMQELADAAIKNHVSHFIYMSTFHVYGPNTVGEINEDTQTNAQSIYAKTHLEAENVLLKNNNLHSSIIRLSNAIGTPRIKDSSAWILVANDLCKQAIIDKKMILLSTGNQKRDFIPATNIGDAIHTILENSAYGIFNLGSERTMSILDLAQIIQQQCQKKFGFIPHISKKEVEPGAIENFPNFTYKTKKLNDLGFKITQSIEEEIGKTLLDISEN